MDLNIGQNMIRIHKNQNQLIWASCKTK